ncbi:MAG TPA: mycothiol system anti-sigma-R factor [Pseudonocardiaceae bacterium]|nr:mycothiol system anti-sigma-R factor [Pseudonocardiaceae bacterium]
MSCGKPHETDCSQVLAEVWLLLDHECDEGHRHKLVEHLDECAPCLERYGIEEHLKLLLARKCGGDRVPEGFKERLRASIRQTVLEQTEVNIERAEDGSSTVEIRETRVEVHGESN